MKLTDIIELAKQGYKPSDIRELLKIETETEPQQDPAPAEPEQPAEDPQQDQEEQPAEDPQQEPDYKALYEEEKAKRQAAARKQEVAKDDSKSVEDTLLDIAKMYI